MKHWDVIIIGSGISSLTSAALLSQRGKSVLVLEKHTKPGGYLHCFKRFGKLFDTGAHYVGSMAPGESFHTLLNYIGVYDPELFIPLSEEGFDEFHFPSFQAKFSFGYEQTIAGLCEKFPDDREGIKNYFQLVKDTAQLFPTYHYNDQYDESKLKIALETPLMSVVQREVKNPKLQCVLLAYCSLHGVKPEDTAFGLHAVTTDSFLRGAYGFRHGGDALANRYVRAIESHGGKVLLKTEVTELKVSQSVIKEVATKHHTYTADWIISGIHPKATLRLIKDPSEHFRPAFLKRIDSLVESPGVMGIYAVCRKPPDFSPDRNYFFFDDECPQTFFCERPQQEKPTMVFVARPERIEAAASTALLFHGLGPISWFEPWRHTQYGKRGADYMAFKDEQAKSILKQVEHFHPGLQAEIQEYSVSSPITNMHFNGSEEGSAYGIYHSIKQTGVRALGPRTHLDNLLLTGQNTLFPGLLGAATSGLRTAGSLLGIKELLRELRQRQVGL